MVFYSSTSNTSVWQDVNTRQHCHTDCKGKLIARSQTTGPPTNQFVAFKITKQTGILWTSRIRTVVSTKLWKLAFKEQCNGLFQGHHTDCTTVYRRTVWAENAICYSESDESPKHHCHLKLKSPSYWRGRTASGGQGLNQKFLNRPRNCVIPVVCVRTLGSGG